MLFSEWGSPCEVSNLRHRFLFFCCQQYIKYIIFIYVYYISIYADERLSVPSFHIAGWEHLRLQ